jgi:hypothetical protein
VIGDAIEQAEVGLLHHHGAEVIPVVEFIVGGALPAAAAVWLGRLRSASGRLTGGSLRSTVTEVRPSDQATARHRSEPDPADHHIAAGPPPLL